ncbi:MAG TPA: hypothetical protein VGQ81_05990, partial [Acidobacteriota bacterium]|nr:hypothetical protein [Acidobacteriota bacterium]
MNNPGSRLVKGNLKNDRVRFSGLRQMKRILSWPPTITSGFLCFLLLPIAMLQVAAPQGSNATRSEKGCRLRVTLRDAATGQPIPARIYLTDQKGESKIPPGVIVYSKKEEQHFIAPPQFQIELPAGHYTLVAERGTEYLAYSAPIELHAGEERNETILMRRWIDMNALGWFSGDLHNHRNVAEMPALLLAEDLNLAPTLADWIWEDRPRSEPPRTSDALRVVDATHVFSVLDKEVERLENGP